MKKMIAILLVLVLTADMLSGCGKKKETVEIFINVPLLSVPCVSNPEYKTSDAFIQAAWEKFAAQYTKYDVKLRGGKVSVFEQTDYQKNITDAYGTADCPDLSFGGYFAMSGYIYDGHIIPLDDIITDAIRADFSEATWAQSKGSNGKTYLMPFFALQNILCYNKELFRQCGLDAYIAEEEIIQGWSLEEWETVLSALKEKLPEFHYPMLMYAKNNQGDTHTMVMLRCMGSSFFDENGFFRLDTPEGIAALQWFKDNYDKGYYPPHCEDIEVAECGQMFFNGQLGIYIWNSALARSVEDLDLGYVNLPAAEAHGANSNWITGFMAFDNGDAKKTETVKDFLKFIYETPEIMDYSTSGMPCSVSVNARWADKLPLGKALAENDRYAVNFTANNPNWAAVREAFWPHIHALLAGTQTAAEAAAGLDRDCNGAIGAAARTLHE